MSWCASLYWAFQPKQFSRNDLRSYSEFLINVFRYSFFGELSVSWIAEFVFTLCIDPKLEVKILLLIATADLGMHYTLASVHPLALASTDFIIIS